MPLFALWSAQNSALSSKSLYVVLESRKPPVPLSATIAPPSARQLALPTRSKLSRPFSPSMSVVQPLPGTQAGSEEQPIVAKLKAKAATSVVRFMFPSSDYRADSLFQTKPGRNGAAIAGARNGAMQPNGRHAHERYVIDRARFSSKADSKRA